MANGHLGDSSHPGHFFFTGLLWIPHDAQLNFYQKQHPSASSTTEGKKVVLSPSRGTNDGQLAVMEADGAGVFEYGLG